VPLVRSPLRGLPAEEQTIPALLERQADLHGARTLVRCGGRERSFTGMRDTAAGWAGRLREQGVRPGDRVVLWGDKRLEVLELWLGCAWLGAVFVPVNTALRGLQLEHALANAAPSLLVVDRALEPELPQLRRSPQRWHTDTLPDPDLPVSPHGCAPGDPAAVLYTSGTTGPSKGVLCPHAQWYWWGIHSGEHLEVTPEDILFTVLPLFHTNALNAFFQALLGGATYVLGPQFSASRFWSWVADEGATVTYLLGAMVSILARREASEADRAHRVRIALSPATPPDLVRHFHERFGVRLLEAYGSTETNYVIGSPWEEQRPGTMGRVVEGFEIRVADEAGCDVPDGQAGELLARSAERHAFASGYLGMPQETADAWRGGWFHSGDRVVRDADGYVTFVDRMKDAIRRRGENISSWEVEQVLAAHPDVAAAAVVPVPAELGEDEVLAYIVPREGATPDPAAIVSFCDGRLAYFAIPRYVDLVDELPLTANGKVAKYALRERGLTARTWDREVAV
jgi:crotonobetaine/carnitine-CoA ligase